MEYLGKRFRIPKSSTDDSIVNWILGLPDARAFEKRQPEEQYDEQLPESLRGDGGTQLRRQASEALGALVAKEVAQLSTALREKLEWGVVRAQEGAPKDNVKALDSYIESVILGFKEKVSTTQTTGSFFGI
ncbi:MAG: hypothetical protein RL033_1296 [Pseudomonadota bacterium]